MSRTLRNVVIMLLIVPALIAGAPRPAHAQWTVIDPWDIIQNTISAIAAPIISFASNNLWIKEYVLDPIAWVLAERTRNGITGSVIKFATGSGNGSGKPQFVQNLLGHLQQVGDSQFSSFLSQLSSTSNSPFSASVVSALADHYLHGTSLNGFWNQIQCTLPKYSPNSDAFLRGDWKQGGVGAWLALTTKDENNQFTLYQLASDKLSATVAGAKSSRSQELSWGQGLLSWCSSGGPTGGAGGGASQTCTNADGSPGTIQTPGSLIKATLDQSVGSGLSKIIQADEIDELIASLVSNLISNALGGSTGGLAGIAQAPPGGGRPFIDDYINSDAGTGSTASTDALVRAVLDNVNKYSAAENTILDTASSAETALNLLSGACATFSTDAQNALNTIVEPAISDGQSGLDEASATVDLANRVQSEATDTSQAARTQYQDDLQTLNSAFPTAADVGTAQANAQKTGGAIATPSGSLNVTGGTLVDQLNLLAMNAAAIQSSCSIPVLPPSCGGQGQLPCP